MGVWVCGCVGAGAAQELNQTCFSLKMKGGRAFTA